MNFPPVDLHYGQENWVPVRSKPEDSPTSSAESVCTPRSPTIIRPIQKNPIYIRKIRPISETSDSITKISVQICLTLKTAQTFWSIQYNPIDGLDSIIYPSLYTLYDVTDVLCPCARRRSLAAAGSWCVGVSRALEFQFWTIDVVNGKDNILWTKDHKIGSGFHFMKPRKIWELSAMQYLYAAGERAYIASHFMPEETTERNPFISNNT